MASRWMQPKLDKLNAVKRANRKVRLNLEGREYTDHGLPLRPSNVEIGDAPINKLECQGIMPRLAYGHKVKCRGKVGGLWHGRGNYDRQMVSRSEILASFGEDE